MDCFARQAVRRTGRESTRMSGVEAQREVYRQCKEWTMLDAFQGRDEQRKLFPNFAGMPSRMAGRRERLEGENIRRKE